MTRLICLDGLNSQGICGYDLRQVENVKLALARCYALDLPVQAQILRTKYNRRNLFHFYLPDNRVFLPFKLRASRIRGDACYGYIDLGQVARLLPGEPPAVKLCSGTSLPLYSDINSARLSYFLGLEILADFVKPQENLDQDLLHALDVMRRLLNGQKCRPELSPSLHPPIRFLPRD